MKDKTVICKWDDRPCNQLSTPCITFIKGGKAAVVCIRFKGDVDSIDSNVLEVN